MHRASSPGNFFPTHRPLLPPSIKSHIKCMCRIQSKLTNFHKPKSFNFYHPTQKVPQNLSELHKSWDDITALRKSCIIKERAIYTNFHPLRCHAAPKIQTLMQELLNLPTCHLINWTDQNMCWTPLCWGFLVWQKEAILTNFHPVQTANAPPKITAITTRTSQPPVHFNTWIVFLNF